MATHTHNHKQVEICRTDCPVQMFGVHDEHHYEPSGADSAVVTEMIDHRIAVYGDPVDTFVRIAQVWTGILGHKVQPTDVPLMMMGMKAVRTTMAPDYSDNTDDIEGYLDIFRKLVGPDMIHARSVSEFVQKKFG